MAFPTTGIVDDCARSNEDPLTNGGYWGIVSNAQLSGNVIRSVTASGFYAISTPTYGDDAEVYVSIFTRPDIPDFLSLYLRFDTVGGNYYICQLNNFDGTAFKGAFWRALGGVEAEIYNTGGNTETMEPGDHFGFSVIGTTLSAYRNGNLTFSTTNNEVTAGGSLAILGGDNAVAYAFVGGGTYSAPVAGSTSAGLGGLLMGIGR